MNTAPHISQLREHLLKTLEALRDRENPMDPVRAKAVAEVASVVVDTAKVEVDYLRVTGQDRAGFLQGSPTALPAPDDAEVTAHNPFPGVTRHVLEG